MKYIKIIPVIIMGALIALYVYKTAPRGLHIGIIVPAQHAALDMIVQGFTQEFSRLHTQPVYFDIQNAQGDLNLQRSIIQKLISQDAELLVPIGKAATQMTAQCAGGKTVVCLAAKLSPQEQAGYPTCKLTGVCEEFSKQKHINLLQAVCPNIHKITLILSASEKVIPEALDLQKYALQAGIEVQKLMVQTLAELYTVSTAIDADSQGVFVLKDHLVVSGINTLVTAARARKIPLIVSDEGSITNGADFALGVREKEIGVYGARLAAHVLHKKIDPKTHGIEQIEKLCVFIRPGFKQEQPETFARLNSYAKKEGYKGEPA